jgi:hypothetical protein
MKRNNNNLKRRKVKKNNKMTLSNAIVAKYRVPISPGLVRDIRDMEIKAMYPVYLNVGSNSYSFSAVGLVTYLSLPAAMASSQNFTNTCYVSGVPIYEMIMVPKIQVRWFPSSNIAASTTAVFQAFGLRYHPLLATVSSGTDAPGNYFAHFNEVNKEFLTNQTANQQGFDLTLPSTFMLSNAGEACLGNLTNLQYFRTNSTLFGGCLTLIQPQIVSNTGGGTIEVGYVEFNIICVLINSMA